MKKELVLNAGNSGDGTRRKRRSVIPDKPEHPLNLWSIMRSCIGKVSENYILLTLIVSSVIYSISDFEYT
jgi:hypothetical protein